MKSIQTFVVVAVLAFTSLAGYSEAKAATNTGTTPTPAATKLPIDQVKERYWDRGRETELRVVQNRLYSQANKVEFGLFGGFVSSDPFLSEHNFGLSLAYHFNDMFAVTAFGWKYFVSNSSALDTLEGSKNVTANTNKPSSFYGAEFDYVPIYGKLSLVGSSIIYFDLHVDIGAGAISTETGKNIAPFIGLGEQIYLNKFSSLRLDYRLMKYNEDIAQKTYGSPDLGSIVASKTQWDNVITIGFSVFGKLF